MGGAETLLCIILRATSHAQMCLSHPYPHHCFNPLRYPPIGRCLRAELELFVPGVRSPQAQILVSLGVPHFRHSCDVLKADPIEDWLSRVCRWVDVVATLLNNRTYSHPGLCALHTRKCGIVTQAYRPLGFSSMSLDDWPTLGDVTIDVQGATPLSSLRLSFLLPLPRDSR